MVERSAILRSYLATRRRRRADRTAVARHQYEALLGHPRLAPLMRGAPSLDEALGRLPLLPVAAWRDNFAVLNRYGVTLGQARAFAESERAGRQNAAFPDVSFGLSTGTSGASQVFLSTAAERAVFLGTILAKFVAPTRLLGCRVALLLKHNSALYADVAGTHIIRFAYFDLAEPIERLSGRLGGFAPNVVVGSPSALLAVTGTRDFARRPLRPHTLIVGAEPLFPSEQSRLTDAYGTIPRPIYQASEGFLAAGCREGRLHVNEDVMIAEWQRFLFAPERAVPVITDFTRRSQDVFRVQLDDVVRLHDREAAGRCGCGGSHQLLPAVEGRLGDVLYGCTEDKRFARFPFDLEAVIGPQLDPAGQWQITQSMPHGLSIATEQPLSGTRQRELRDCLFQIGGWTEMSCAPLPPQPLSVKRRRFVRLIDPSSSRLLAALHPPVRM